MPLLFRLLLVAVAASLAVSGRGQPTAADTCSSSMCQRHTCSESVDVHYPFYLANESRAIDEVSISYCGYPGMAITCDDDTGTATLQLGWDRANYTVLGISYENKTITLADAGALAPGGCPRVSRNVTIVPPSLLNFSDGSTDYLSFFLGCAFTAAIPQPRGIVPISCSGFREEDARRKSYLAPRRDTPAGDWFVRACKTVVVAPVLRDLLRSPEYLPRLGSDGYGKLMEQGFELSWDPSAGPCIQCEESGGQCSYDQDRWFLGCLCSDGHVRKSDCGTSTQRTPL